VLEEPERGQLPASRRTQELLLLGLGGGFQFGRLHLLDLDQLLLDGGGLRLDVLGSHLGLGAGGLGVDHELAQEEQADVVIGALLPDLERGVDGVQQPQQVRRKNERKASVMRDSTRPPSLVTSSKAKMTATMVVIMALADGRKLSRWMW
jgi:hypothetical protein